MAHQSRKHTLKFNLADEIRVLLGMLLGITNTAADLQNGEGSCGISLAISCLYRKVLYRLVLALTWNSWQQFVQ